MQIIEKRITLEDVSKPMKLFISGDWHVGTPNCDMKSISLKIEEIKNTPNAYLALVGDLAECIELKDKRFSISSVDKIFYPRLSELSVAQYDYIKDLLTPIKDKILCAVPGNHEEKIKSEYCHDIHLDLCRTLNIPNMGTAGFLKIKFDRSQFHAPELITFLTHGWVGGRSSGSKINAVENLSQYFEADLYAMGHSHNLFVSSKSRLSVAGSHTKSKDVWFCNTGSYLQTYVDEQSCYAEKMCLPPNKLGCPKFTIDVSSGGLKIKGEI
jgi:predicted phosphodiesterase